MTTPTKEARTAFNSYAAMTRDELPADQISALQVRLARWQAQNFGVGNDTHPALGVVEEMGEALEAFLGFALSCGRLAKSVLKADQRIRGLGDRDRAREAVADGIADLTIYAIQLCTAFRLDFGTILKLTAEKVMERDWNKYPETGLP